MNKQVLTSLIAFGFAALLGSIPAAAQAKQTATIPFAFEAGGAAYPEGPYGIQRMDGTTIIRLTNLNTGHSAVFGAPILSGAQASDAKLVFHQNGDRLMLREIWFAGYPVMLTTASGKQVSAKVVVGLR